MQGNESYLTQTPVNINARVPKGHIVVNDKWRNSDIISNLQSGVNVLYEDNLGIVDFHPTNDVGVIYLSEANLVTGSSYKRKLVKLRKAQNLKGIVIAEKTTTTAQYFSSLQKFVVLEIGLVLLPVTSHQELARLLIQMVYTGSHCQTNPFLLRQAPSSADAAVLATVRSIPKLGEVKAKVLLEKFICIQGICDASKEDLASVVGRASGEQVHSFFNNA